MRHLGVQRVEGVGGGRFTGGEIVVAVHEDLGLDDRHDPGLLAEGGVAGHRVAVRDAGERGRQPVADDDRGAPFRESCPQAVILGEAFPQPVEPFGDRFAGEGRERLGAGVHLDPRDHALPFQHRHERRAVLVGLADRLVEQDHAADVLPQPGGREQQLTVSPAGLFGGGDPDRVEPFADRAGGFVGGQDPLGGCHQGAGRLVQGAHVPSCRPTVRACGPQPSGPVHEAVRRPYTRSRDHLSPLRRAEPGPRQVLPALRSTAVGARGSGTPAGHRGLLRSRGIHPTIRPGRPRRRARHAPRLPRADQAGGGALRRHRRQVHRRRGHGRVRRADRPRGRSTASRIGRARDPGGRRGPADRSWG